MDEGETPLPLHFLISDRFGSSSSSSKLNTGTLLGLVRLVFLIIVVCSFSSVVIAATVVDDASRDDESSVVSLLADEDKQHSSSLLLISVELRLFSEPLLLNVKFW